MFSGGRYTGADKTKRDLENLEKGAPKIIGDALFEEVKEVEVPECKDATPVETGNLQDTIHAAGPFIEGKKVSVQVLAGDTLTDDYALIVHEDMDAIHETGGPKYVERPLRESAPYMKDRIAPRLDFSKALK